jgi:hypothetical protein
VRFVGCCLPNKAMKEKKDPRAQRKHKRTAKIVCRNEKEFWTTQAQFWQWVRELKVIQVGNNPLTGVFANSDEETMVVLYNSVLNLAHPNHLSEAIRSRRQIKRR